MICMAITPPVFLSRPPRVVVVSTLGEGACQFWRSTAARRDWTRLEFPGE